MATPQPSLATARELRRLLADIRRIREWSSNLPDLSAYIANAVYPRTGGGNQRIGGKSANR